MSNYISQYVPDQLKTMLSKLKEATIDMGPLPVKFSQFSEITKEALQKACKNEEKTELQIKSLLEKLPSDQQLFHCLFIVTDIAIELWVIKNTSLFDKNLEMDIVFRKHETGVELIDFIHVVPMDNSRTTTSDINQDSKEETRERKNSNDQSPKTFESGVYDHEAPLIGYTVNQNQEMLKIYSLKSEKTLHILRFGSPVIKFQTSCINKSNQMVLLLQEGLIKLFNLSTMEQEISIKCFHLNNKLNNSIRNGSKQNLKHQLDSQILAAAFPLDFDMSQNLYAYIYNEVNEADLLEEINKNVDSSLLGQYFLTKEVTKQLIQFGHTSFNKLMNLLNVQKASTIDKNQLQQAANKMMTNNSGCKCKKNGTSHEFFDQISQIRSFNNSQNKSIRGLENLQDQSYTTQNSQFNRSRLNSDSNKYADDPTLKPLSRQQNINKQNVFSVRIRDLATNTLFAEIIPPFFQNISSVRFSPSGRLLVIGNENCQYFYVYEILPQTNQRFYRCRNQCPQEKFRLSYSLFRGYTSAMVSDIQFVNTSQNYSDKEQIIIINSSNGTSHIFDLQKEIRVQETPISKFKPDDNLQPRIFNLTATQRFKYKSMIKQGELRLVSLVLQKPNQEFSNNLSYRLYTYTSKNEFYVIDLFKDKKALQKSEGEDIGISTADFDFEESKTIYPESDESQQQNIYMNTNEMFQLNISQGTFTKVNKEKSIMGVCNNNNEAEFFTGQPKPSKNPQLQWLKEAEIQSFYPSLMIEQKNNPAVTFSEPTSEFLQQNNDLYKEIYSVSLYDQLDQLVRQDDTIVKQNNNLTQFIMEQENYFDQQSVIPKDMSISQIIQQDSYDEIENQMRGNQFNQQQLQERDDEMIFAPSDDNNDLKSSKIIDFRVEDQYYS